MGEINNTAVLDGTHLLKIEDGVLIPLWMDLPMTPVTLCFPLHMNFRYHSIIIACNLTTNEHVLLSDYFAWSQIHGQSV